MSMKINDSGLRRAFQGMLDDNKITKDEAQKLIDQANKPGWLDFLTGRVSNKEKTDLKRILTQLGDKFDQDAKDKLAGFLGLPVSAPVVTPADTTVTPETQLGSDRVSTLTDMKKVAETFTAEIGARASAFNTPEKAMGLFAQYAGKLKALGQGQDPRAVEAEVEKLLTAGRNSPARGYDAKDTDHDTLSDLRETAMGRDPGKFETRVMGAETPAWTTTYYPSAGSGDMDQPGNPSSNLWAKEGALGKLDKLLTARGMTDKAKALEFERKPMLTWLVGERSTGHFAPNANLSEANAEMTTGVDFDGDGKLSAGVKVDFLNAHGDFAAVSSRNALIPKLGTETLTRKQVTDAQGNKSFEFFKAGGQKLTPEEMKNVFYTHAGSDGKVDGTMSISWWGMCDQTALAGILFKEPMKNEVTVDGVKFSKQDMLGLLTIIASSQSKGTDFVGNRFDDRPDILVLKSGEQLQGKLLDSVEFRTKDMWRWDGDYMVLNSVDKDLKFRKMDGTEVTVKAADVKHLAREDQMDMAPAEFHSTMLKWLGEDKRAAVMDRDSGSHVWNYNFWRATLKEAKELKGTDIPKDPGHNGPANPQNKVVQYDMEVLLGTSTSWGNNYKYWLETDPAGKVVNGGWVGTDPPDFLWRPSNTPSFTGANPRNPYVDPQMVKEIYDKFMTP
jgi:hypothetical protein